MLTTCPHIYGLPIRFSLEHFWRQVARGACKPWREGGGREEGGRREGGGRGEGGERKEGGVKGRREREGR